MREAKKAVQPTEGKEKKSIYCKCFKTIITLLLELIYEKKKERKENIVKLSNCKAWQWFMV